MDGGWGWVVGGSEGGCWWWSWTGEAALTPSRKGGKR